MISAKAKEQATLKLVAEFAKYLEWLNPNDRKGDFEKYAKTCGKRALDQLVLEGIFAKEQEDITVVECEEIIKDAAERILSILK